MKKILLIITALTLVTTGFAQSAKTNRTNSRSHYPPDTTRGANSRMDAKTDADKNNPTNTTNPPATNTPASPNNSNNQNNNPNNPNATNNRR